MLILKSQSRAGFFIFYFLSASTSTNSHLHTLPYLDILLCLHGKFVRLFPRRMPSEEMNANEKRFKGTMPLYFPSEDRIFYPACLRSLNSNKKNS